MLARSRVLVALGSSAALALLGACAGDAPTNPRTAASTAAAVAAGGTPSGERQLGQSSIEPAYDAATGQLLFLLTPLNSPFPSKANVNAQSPLYLVEYPPGAQAGTTLNCMGVPGNCPDHDGEVAGAATKIMPGVYGTDPTLVPGHDHIVDKAGPGADFNVAWRVIEVLFTNRAAANKHLTTEAAIDSAVARHDAIKVDLGFAFHCSIVSATTYWRGTPG